MYLFIILDAPKVRLELVHHLDPSKIKEGTDLYFTCHVDARPPADVLVWTHGVSWSNQFQSCSLDKLKSYTEKLKVKVHNFRTKGVVVHPNVKLFLKKVGLHGKCYLLITIYETNNFELRSIYFCIFITVLRINKYDFNG